ncbi:MAG: IPExxxVDY family protein [Ginsengibacter sp.]
MMKLRIDNSVMVDEFFANTRLLGIVAPIEHYRFCWHLNQILNFNFRINNNIEIQLNKKERKYFFPIYEYGELSGTIKHYLYNNEDDGEYLLPEFKHLDFLWLIKDDIMHDEEINILISSIRTIPAVQLITEMTNEKIKNKQHLIF